MELIKQIKDAENQAKDIVEKAKQEASAVIEAARKQRAERIQQAQKRRNQAIDDAVALAEQDGKAQTEQLSGQGQEQIAALKASASKKMQSCVEKVVSRVQQMS